jgi:hypothetical protein
LLTTKNVILRKTAHVFHSLGFFWARETGMFDLESHSHSCSSTLASAAGDAVLEDEWKTWAAKETQLRALLGETLSLSA